MIEVSGKEINVQHVEGPVGVLARNFSKERMYSLGWKTRVTLKEGIVKTYPWIAEQVERASREARR